MTILEANNILIDFFYKKHSLNLEKDFKELITLTETPELDKEILLLALDGLIKSDIVVKTKVEIEAKDYFILVKPLDHYKQTISIGKATAVAIANIMANVADTYKNEEYLVDVLNIKESDIHNVLIIAQNAIKK